MRLSRLIIALCAAFAGTPTLAEPKFRQLYEQTLSPKDEAYFFGFQRGLVWMHLQTVEKYKNRGLFCGWVEHELALPDRLQRWREWAEKKPGRSEMELTTAFLAFVEDSYPCTADVEDYCRGNDGKADLCATAKQIQQFAYKNLPQQVSRTLSFDNILAAGKVISVSATWRLTKKQIDESMASSNVTDDVLNGRLQDQARLACGDPELEKFVRLGGEIRYLYSTIDAAPLGTASISKCP